MGRILRQPYAAVTPIRSLNESYVFCYNPSVREVVEGIKKGLQAEGMDDIVDHVKVNGEDYVKRTAKRRHPFGRTKIFLPRVLHKEKNKWRNIIYEADILEDIDFSKMSYTKRDSWTPGNIDALQVGHTRIDIEETGQFSDETTAGERAAISMDFSYMVERLSNIVPNPWQAARILGETLDALEAKGVSKEKVYLNRAYLLQSIESDIQQQIEVAAEKIFTDKLSAGVLCFKIFKDRINLNWQMPKEIEFFISRNDRRLRNAYDTDLELYLFDYTPAKHYNPFEEKVALYLDDEKDTLNWWHRIIARQDYALQGWQKRKMYPDFLACTKADSNKAGDFPGDFIVLETKGDHLRGNTNTEYKAKVFELLEKHANNPLDVGGLETASADEQKMVFRILMETGWKDEIKKALSDRGR